MKRLMALLWVALLMLSHEVAGAPPTTVTIANTPWQPYFGADLPQYGVAADIITHAFQRSGYRTEYQTRPWARALRELRYGEHDALATAYFTVERAQHYLFSMPYMSSEVRLYQRQGAGIRWTRLQDLKPYTIGTVLDNAYSQAFDAADYLNKDVATTEILNIRKLVAGRIDLFVMDRYVFEHLIGQFPEYRSRIEALEPALHRPSLHVMFSKQADNVELKVDAFNRGLEAIRRDETLQKIIQRHLAGE